MENGAALGDASRATDFGANAESIPMRRTEKRGQLNPDFSR